MDTKQAILTRQSIREYDPTFKIDEATLLQLLQEASTAPKQLELTTLAFCHHSTTGIESKASSICFF